MTFSWQWILLDDYFKAAVTMPTIRSIIDVRTLPGLSALTPTPYRPDSRAAAFVKPRFSD